VKFLINISNSNSRSHHICDTYALINWNHCAYLLLVPFPTPNTQAGGPPLVGFPRLLIRYIRSCPPYLEVFPPSETSGRPMPWWQETHPTWSRMCYKIFTFFFKVTLYISRQVTVTVTYCVCRQAGRFQKLLFFGTMCFSYLQYTRVYPKVSGLAAYWSENCKWYSSLPLGPVVSLFCEFCLHNTLCCFSTSVYCCAC
jgi:hypothetical protein